MAKPNNQDHADRLPIDTMAEDLFGLNIRGVKSIFTLWRHPNRYFAAARQPDWNNQYTPSIRLWLSFFAVFSALKFWWFGSNQGMVDAYAAGFEGAALNLLEDMTYADMASEAIMWTYGLVPILQIVCIVLLALVYPFWGQPTTISLRQRYMFGVIVPNASLMPVVLSIMVFVPESMLGFYGAALALLTLFVDWQAGYRGPFVHLSTFGRVWRSTLLAIILVIIHAGTNLIAQIAGIMMMNQKYGAIPIS